MADPTETEDQPAATGGFDMEAGVAAVSDALGYESKDDADIDPDAPDDKAAAPATPPAAPAPPAGTLPAPAPAAPAASPAPAAAGRFTAEKAPDTWKPEEASHWAAIPEPVRATIARRENDMLNGLAQYRDGHSFGKSMAETLRPVADHLQSTGIPPDRFVGNLVQAHLLLTDTKRPAHEKVAFLHQIAKANGIDLAADSAEPVYVDPQVSALQTEIAGLKSQIGTVMSSAEQQRRADINTTVEKYFRDNPEAIELSDDIARLISASGGKLPLAEAHEQAKWLNPVSRRKEVDRIATERAKSAAKVEADRVAAARKAKGATVRTSGHQGNGTAARGSMDDTLAETLAAMKSR